MVEHSTADREVPGSIPGVPFVFVFLFLSERVCACGGGSRTGSHTHTRKGTKRHSYCVKKKRRANLKKLR